MQATIKHHNFEFTISDEDFIEGAGYCYEGEYNPHRVKPWVIHEHGFVLCVVFADCEQDALDYAVDADKLDKFQIKEEDLKDYGEEGEGITYLGNASEAFDIQNVEIFPLPLYKLSHVALIKAAQEEKEANAQ